MPQNEKSSRSSVFFQTLFYYGFNTVLNSLKIFPRDCLFLYLLHLLFMQILHDKTEIDTTLFLLLLYLVDFFFIFFFSDCFLFYQSFIIFQTKYNAYQQTNKKTQQLFPFPVTVHNKLILINIQTHRQSNNIYANILLL